MGRIVVTEFITLDGVIEDPGGSEKTERGGWAFSYERGPEGDKFKFDELMAADAQLLGRVTYEGFAEAWPSRTGEFADKINNSPKYVVSSTLTNPTWQNTTVISATNLRDEVVHLTKEYEGDVLVAGSAQLVQALMAQNLVDELRLMVFPVVLGKGKRLFTDDADMTSYQIIETRQAGEVAIITLQRKA